MRGVRRLVILAFAASALGQLMIGGSTFGTNEYTSNICGETTAAANVTGLYSWNPDVAQLNQGQTSPIDWLATISQTSGSRNGSMQYALWFSPGPANYSYDLGLGYDVCAYALVLENTNWFRRAQEDDGDCTTAFDASCVDDIEKAAQGFALDMTLDPTTHSPRSNLTADSILKVCTDIAGALQDNFPASCSKFMNSSTPVKFDGGALTSSNHSPMYDQCNITDPSSDNTFYHVATYNRYTANNPEYVKFDYTYFNYITLPILTIFMPVANAKAGSVFYISNAASKLQCVRPTDVAKGSKTPSPAPAPTPYGSGGLSGGDIAGIVVGVVAGIMLILAGVLYFWWKRRRQAKKLDTFDPAEAPPAYITDAKVQSGQLDTSQEHKPVVEAADTAVAELSPGSTISKPGTSDRPVELEGDGDLAVEKEASEPPVELPANVPRMSS